jgi:sec-independent protein translocase protein TatA
MFNLGVPEMAVLLVIGLLLFGHRLPEMARMLGKAVTELRREAGSLTDELSIPRK